MSQIWIFFLNHQIFEKNTWVKTSSDWNDEEFIFLMTNLRINCGCVGKHGNQP